MRRRAFAALGLALLLAGSSAIAAPAGNYPTGVFTVAGHKVAPKDILDARALPDTAGKPSLMVTLTPDAAKALTAGAHGPRLPCALDGKPLGDSAAASLSSDNVIQLSGDFGDYAAASALARRISGHDPVPDSETDE